MRLRTVKRHFREGLKNSWRNSWMTLASIAAVTTTLILVGTFIALLMNINHIAQSIEEDVEIKVYIDLTATEESIDELGERISTITNVQNVTFSSRDDELQNLISSMGEQGSVWDTFMQDNPLLDAYVVEAINPQDTMEIAAEIEDFNGVDYVNYGQEVVEALFAFNNFARNIGLILIAALLFTAIFLISNTIKITIFARRKEIEIMKLVGATNWFIRWPFFVEGLLLGVLGSIIPIALLAAIYNFLIGSAAINQFDFIQILPFNPFIWQLGGLILLIGAGIGVWGSVMSVRKFLKV
ncbi:cell division protein FtsX [Amphibacillus marinus]|uniref:Cell division protein FtsX n=1 Tax=Amphibacillus marinus TaxID=872970 RepID=A0A1H8IPE3_9BACI|nr:permease-like cell division protein FtsX [Amphibacillus marinus]SEN70201.1 cell division protein FtsX [Amphibacillus marinus]